MKVYTGTGDQGKTSLFSGERIAKSDSRIAAYGAVDELNAIVGALAAALPAAGGADGIRTQLVGIQSDLFHVGAWLATTPDSPAAAHLSPFTDAYQQRIEAQIDAMDDHLEPLNAFILPGGHPSAAWAHVARTVCRRAERQAVRLADRDAPAFQGAQEVLVYLNRLSDYFFVLARYCNAIAGMKDQLWHE
jgi:cob(I)alamin adenosyltransferase